MSRSGITAMYDEFDDNDNTDGNDDDMAALDSILSWDDAEETDNGGNKGENAVGDSTDNNNSSRLTAPFDTLQFPTRNGMNDLGNMQNSDSNYSSNGTNGMTYQAPTPISTPNFVQQQQQLHEPQKGSQNATMTGITGQSADQQQMQQNQTFMMNPQQQNQHGGMSQPQQNQSSMMNPQQQIGSPLNLSPEQQQFIAQNPQAFAHFLANTVLQHNQAQGQQQSVQQQHVPAANMFGNLPTQPTVQHVQEQQQQQQQQQQNLQVVQQQQLPYASDPNALLQQFQMVQFQQQMQAAQAQQQAQTAPSIQIQNALQQLQAQFVQAQGNALQTQNQTNVNQGGRQIDGANAQPEVSHQKAGSASHITSSSRKASGAPPSKKPKLANSATAKKTSLKAPPKTKLPVKSTDTSMTGTVSASDTEAEASRKAKYALDFDCPTSDNENDNDIDDIDLSHLSPSEKLKANRDRNREHARNTRLRKKAYLEKLKSTVDELCRERDTLVSERASAANLLVEMHNIRTEVLMSFLALRTSNERRRKLWSSILDESCFACVMPVTPYRSFPASEVQVSKCLRTILGIDGILADTASLHVLFDSLVDRSQCPTSKIEFRYTLVTEEAVVAGNQMMARWVMTTTNAVQNGARMEVAKQGMLCCKFNSAHKIIGLEFMFDVMAFMLQLKQASGSEGFTVIPNTVQTCQRTFDKPMVVTLAEPPYTIIQVNKLWEDMTGYDTADVVGRASCAILQGADMDKMALCRMMDEVRYKRPASSLVVNRMKDGKEFTNFIVVYPLSTDSRITYFLGLSLHHSLGRPLINNVTAPPLVTNTYQQPNQNLSAPLQQTSIGMPVVLNGGQIQAMQSQSIMSTLFPGMNSVVTDSSQCSTSQLGTTPQISFVQPAPVPPNIGSSLEFFAVDT